MCYVKKTRKATPKTTPRHPPRLEKALDLFRRWGREGARRRAEKLSPERRREIARKAIAARWAKRRKERT